MSCGERIQNPPHNPSPLLVGDELYFVSDNGIASCVDAKTGKSHCERLGGDFLRRHSLPTGGFIF